MSSGLCRVEGMRATPPAMYGLPDSSDGRQLSAGFSSALLLCTAAARCLLSSSIPALSSKSKSSSSLPPNPAPDAARLDGAGCTPSAFGRHENLMPQSSSWEMCCFGMQSKMRRKNLKSIIFIAFQPQRTSDSSAAASGASDLLVLCETVDPVPVPAPGKESRECKIGPVPRRCT